MILSVRSTWENLSSKQVVLAGVLLGVLLCVVPHAVFGWPVMVPGLLVYFPFHAVLSFLAFGVLLSNRRRTRIFGDGVTPIGAFFACFFLTKFGQFCLSWFFTMWLYWAYIDGV